MKNIPKSFHNIVPVNKTAQGYRKVLDYKIAQEYRIAQGFKIAQGYRIVHDLVWMSMEKVSILMCTKKIVVQVTKVIERQATTITQSVPPSTLPKDN